MSNNLIFFSFILSFCFGSSYLLLLFLSFLNSMRLSLFIFFFFVNLSNRYILYKVIVQRFYVSFFLWVYLITFCWHIFSANLFFPNAFLKINAFISITISLFRFLSFCYNYISAFSLFFLFSLFFISSRMIFFCFLLHYFFFYPFRHTIIYNAFPFFFILDLLLFAEIPVPSLTHYTYRCYCIFYYFLFHSCFFYLTANKRNVVSFISCNKVCVVIPNPRYKLPMFLR